MKKVFFSALILLSLAFPLKALAFDVPNFPSCSNPNGNIIASYDSGVHGIPGNPGRFEGSDKVYKVNDTQVVQCFCGSDGIATETNWLKLNQISEEDIDKLVKQGWVFVPSGNVWGLSSDPYLAQNANYRCGDKGGQITETAASTSVSDPTVLGLAYTGDSALVLLLATLSFTSLVLAIISKKRNV